MTKLIDVLIIALACPLILPIVIEDDEERDDTEDKTVFLPA